MIDAACHRRGRGSKRNSPRLDLPNVLWFFAAGSAAIASNAIVDDVTGSQGGLWKLVTALGFLVAYALAAALLLRRRWWVPGGVTATLAVAIVHAAGYGLTKLVGAYPDDPFFDPLEDFSGAVFGIALATVAAGLVAFVLTRFAFTLAFTVGAALVAVQLVTTSWESSGGDRALAALVSGAVAVGLGLFLDTRALRREAFWPYVWGYAAIGVALGYYVAAGHGSETAWVALLVIGALVLVGAALVRRRAWAVYGALGVYTAIVHYLDRAHWARYLLLAVAIGVFSLGLRVARRRRGDADAATP